jgi:hypothetical protein
LRTAQVHPNAENATLDELSVAMEAALNKRSYIRLNAIRSLLLGIPRATLCQQFCRTDRMVRLWIELFNRGGIDALITKPRPGRRRKVKLERVRDLIATLRKALKADHPVAPAPPLSVRSYRAEAVRLMKQIRATFSATFMMAAPAVLATDALPLYDIGRMCRWQQDVRWTPGYRRPQSTDEYTDCLDRDRRAYNRNRGT